MFSPVAWWEWRWAAQRTRPMGFRAAWGGLLFAELLLLAWACQHHLELELARGELVEAYLRVLLTQHLLLAVVLTPAWFASALADEKENGTLPLLLTTQLAPWEVVAGKLVARGWQVFLLANLDLPLFCMAACLTDEITFATILRVQLATLAIIVLLGGWSLWVSLRARQARSAASFLFVTLCVAAAGLWAQSVFLLPWLKSQAAMIPRLRPWARLLEQIPRCFDLQLLLEPLGSASAGPSETALVLALALLFAAGLLVLTVARLRHEANRGHGPKEPRRGPRRPGVGDEDPIRWREQLLGSGWQRWAQAVTVAFATPMLANWLTASGNPWSLVPLWFVGSLLLALFIGIRASGAISGERNRQTWESLLLTPLDTWEILLDKRRGLILAYWQVLLAFIFPATFYSVALGWQPALLGVGLLGFLAGLVTYFVSLGLQRSTFSRGSGQPLVSTVLRGFGYVVVNVIAVALALAGGYFLLTLPFISMVLEAAGVHDFLEKWSLLLASGLALVLGWRFYQAGNTRLWDAQVWIDNYERYGRTLFRSLSRALRHHYDRRPVNHELVLKEKPLPITRPGPRTTSGMLKIANEVPLSQRDGTD